jgi:uncharacterized protein
VGPGVSVLRGADGRVRSGWVVGLFVVVAMLLIVGANLGAMLASLHTGVTLDDPHLLVTSLSNLLGGVGATTVCVLLFKEPVGLRDAFAVRRLLVGVSLGAVALTVACGVPALLGVTSLELNTQGVADTLAHGLKQLVVLAPTAIAEELLLRGVPLQALRRGLGDLAAVLITGGVFGLLHLSNPNASLIAALNVALVGVWFGLLTVRTGSLWVAMGLHVSWNFCEGFVFGQPVSGLTPAASLLVSHWPSSRGFFSGGDFGPEAAGWTALLLVVSVAISAIVSRRTPSL